MPHVLQREHRHNTKHPHCESGGRASPNVPDESQAAAGRDDTVELPQRLDG